MDWRTVKKEGKRVGKKLTYVDTNYNTTNYFNNYCQNAGESYSWCWTSSSKSSRTNPSTWGTCHPNPTMAQADRCRATFKKNYRPKGG